jgi:hypothetical protein
MDRPSGFLVLVILAAVNTLLMGLIAWQLWVVRSRFDRLDFVVASFIGGIVNRVRGVINRAAWLAHQIGRVIERITMSR